MADMRVPFVQASNFTRVGLPPREINLLVVHDMESPEGPETAENVARFFRDQEPHDPPRVNGSSTHYNIDSNSIVQSVRDKDVAWAAPGANHDGLHFEHAGRARQTAAQWDDGYSRAMLQLSAKFAAQKCAKHGIPVVYVNALGLQRGLRGVTTHLQVSLAFHRSTHTDPGLDFPMARYLSLIRKSMGREPLLERTGFFAWLAWHDGLGDWAEFGPKDPGVRPNVPANITRDRPGWWVRRVAFHAARKKR